MGVFIARTCLNGRPLLEGNGMCLLYVLTERSTWLISFHSKFIVVYSPAYELIARVSSGSGWLQALPQFRIFDFTPNRNEILCSYDREVVIKHGGDSIDTTCAVVRDVTAYIAVVRVLGRKPVTAVVIIGAPISVPTGPTDRR